MATTGLPPAIPLLPFSPTIFQRITSARCFITSCNVGVVFVTVTVFGLNVGDKGLCPGLRAAHNCKRQQKCRDNMYRFHVMLANVTSHPF